MSVWRWLVTSLLGLLCLLGCTAVPDPTPTLVQNMAEVATLVVKRPSATPLPTLPPTPQPTFTVPPAPISTPFIDEDPFWQANIQASYVETGWIEWSPVANEFIFDTCGDIYSERDLNGDIFIAVAPMFESFKISPTNTICDYLAMSEKIWTVDGQKIFYAGLVVDSEAALYPGESAQVWVMDRGGQNTNPVGNAVDRYLGFAGWMDENTLIYNGYAGGGHIHIALLDILSGESFASTIVHSGGVYHVNDAYIGTQNGWAHAYNITAAVISRIPQELEDEDADELFNPFLYPLSSDFNSRYEGWLSDANSMLVLTWEKEFALWDIDLLHDPAITQLQLWNVDTDELILLVSEAIRGRFSPDGRFLAYVTPGNPAPFIFCQKWGLVTFCLCLWWQSGLVRAMSTISTSLLLPTAVTSPS